MQRRIDCFVDGSCYRGHKEKLGGWGVYLQLWQNDQLMMEKLLNCGYSYTSTSRMEQRAVCVALEIVKWREVPIRIIMDSEMVANAINEEWVFKWENEGWDSRDNADLWQRFLEAYRSFNPDLIEVIHTRGHFKGDPEFWYGNNIADALADYKQFQSYIEDGSGVV